MVTLVSAWCQQIGKFYQLSSKESGGCDTSNEASVWPDGGRGVFSYINTPLKIVEILIVS